MPRRLKFFFPIATCYIRAAASAVQKRHVTQDAQGLQQVPRMANSSAWLVFTSADSPMLPDTTVGSLVNFRCKRTAKGKERVQGAALHGDSSMFSPRLRELLVVAREDEACASLWQTRCTVLSYGISRAKQRENTATNLMRRKLWTALGQMARKFLPVQVPSRYRMAKHLLRSPACKARSMPSGVHWLRMHA